MNSFDICDCNCHNNENMKHCMPCCTTCSYCGQNIIFGFFKEHDKKCKETYENLTRLIKKGNN